jgi:hypothetical protein
MGHHDPLDGLLTYQKLQAGCGGETDSDLSSEIADLAELCAGRHWETDDPLGIGGLLCDAWRLACLLADGTAVDPALLSELLGASIRGLDALTQQRLLEHPASSRIAFREFGLSLGLHALGRLRDVFRQPTHALSGRADCEALLRGLARYELLAQDIERFWQQASHRMSPTWQDHRDINDVMFATSLAPGGFLGVEA